MNESAAPAPRLAGLTPRMQIAVEDQLVALAQGLANCLDRAQTATPKSTCDDIRSSERRDAVQLADATATLLKAVSGLRGEFRHNYNVTRIQGEAAAPRSKWPAPDGYNTRTYPYLSAEQINALSVSEYNDYEDMTRALPSHRDQKPQAGAEDAAIAQLKRDIERVADAMDAATPSPSENGGSNGKVGPSVRTL